MTNEHIEAVIFDLDGTLIDSEPVHYLAEKELLQAYGIDGFTMEMKKPYIGKSTESIMEALKEKYHLDASLESLVAEKIKRYLYLAYRNMDVYPEMRTFLQQLKNSNIPLAIASGSSRSIIEEILKITELQPYFSVVVSAEEVAAGKPAPDVFLKAANDLSINPERCVVLEDSQYGVEAAKRAKMYAIAIPYLSEPPLHPLFGQADLLFEQGMSQFSASKAIKWINEKR
ncbi:Haloacid dehalogenase superfamily, subfamily IA, variant 2 with 3rd motif like haloacid dehalogenase/haloacid dehalogenase superfamily, subfamily IA, variant 3 with third motif having DD or ED/haloacid dehalogenase superfamily, subfamily IA, variant 1 with third motif having Dx(3-4)D or Dx(3-4)E/beta-phosphoglucomutase family hydrolase [Seinonella peptonophila]|uniref:Uncharacterized protein n=1 Tax=Seinonella peptonophila TaxID=112248 RepID=A0A1M4XJ42_9BACL|nr:HAD family phosphatase [Seinonella peptonophila]SHE93677.1 Haloacid dehalogenase superfamily, subfamily IA, variant 2 with 3rd motif like haloacid dehalogenase/haloacid dehalogenase superfamily, subfamily IA, variant 3 with third motif having DD or ED/haloacid dehalogenase superfamily, subfamily IA, variant 1 with third motif having Dx(3-4)D or Dx(3-4)E/beta-phosphoglucomutase family hydrolase [Seinonella peptonophila]